MTVMATYQGGVLVPSGKIDLEEGQVFRLEIVPVTEEERIANNVKDLETWLKTLPPVHFPEGWEFVRGSVYEDP